MRPIVKGKKACASARRANVMGKQSYTGKVFISYAQHDKLTMISAYERRLFWNTP